MGGAFEGKVALVTGASSGIGAASASALIKEGCRVAATARRMERLQALGRQLGAGDDQFLPLQADVRDEASAEKLLADTLAWGGQLDILINNAGLSRGSVLEATKVEDLRMMLDTNIFALVNLTRLATPALKRSRGDVLNVASTMVKTLSTGAAVYAATKAAVVAFSETLRKELLSDGVRVMTIYPGFTQTEFFDAFDEQKRSMFLKLIEGLDALSGEDVAEAIVFVLSRPPNVTINELVIRPTKQA